MPSGAIVKKFRSLFNDIQKFHTYTITPYPFDWCSSDRQTLLLSKKCEERAQTVAKQGIPGQIKEKQNYD